MTRVKMCSLSEIIDLLENAKLTRPDYAPIYMVQAEVQLLQQQPDVAIESMRTALQKRPGEVSYLRRLADTLVSLNRLDEAQSILARLPAEQKRFDDVIAEIRTLLVEAPDRGPEASQADFPARFERPRNLDEFGGSLPSDQPATRGHSDTGTNGRVGSVELKSMEDVRQLTRHGWTRHGSQGRR